MARPDLSGLYGPYETKSTRSSKCVHWTLDAFAATVQDVSINHRRRHVFVTQQFLNRADVIAILQQVRRERMPKRMRGCRLCNASVSYRDFD